ncbi:hypothetical protein D9M72_495380 [compost metagenome]
MPHAGIDEDHLDHDDADDEIGEVEGDDVDDGCHRIGSRMARDDAEHAEALQLRCLDIGRRHHVEDGRTGHAHHMGEHDENQRRDRKCYRRETFSEAHAVIDGRGEGRDAIFDGEEHDQEIADEELGQRDGCERHDVDDLVRQPVAELNRQHAEADGERHGNERCEEGEKQRIAEALADLLADRILAGPGGAEIAFDGTAEPGQVAFGPGLVEAEILADVFNRLRRCGLAEIGGGEVAGKRLDAA